MALSSLALFALVALLGNVHCQFRDETEEVCRGKVMDIFFVLDSSTSIYINDYREQQRFVRDMIQRFDVSDRTTRVGSLAFSVDITRPVLGLGRFQEKNAIASSINEQNLPYRTGITNTHLALRYVRESTEFRTDITKVIVVITDGGSRSPGQTAREAQLAREQGFYLFVVGVGQYMDEREWRAIASDPDDQYIYNITTFRVLDDLKFTLPPRICPLPPLEVYGFCNLDQATDLIFVAGRQGVNDANALIDKFEDRSDDLYNQAQVSYLMPGCNNAENVRLGSRANYCNRFIDNAGNPDFYQEVVKARDIFRRSRQQRQATQVLVLFLDEESFTENRFDVPTEVNALSQGGVKVIVVRLGNFGNPNLLQSMASTSDSFITYSTDVDVSRQISNTRRLLSNTCSAVNENRSTIFDPFDGV